MFDSEFIIRIKNIIKNDQIGHLVIYESNKKFFVSLSRTSFIFGVKPLPGKIKTYTIVVSGDSVAMAEIKIMEVISQPQNSNHYLTVKGEIPENLGEPIHEVYLQANKDAG